MKRLDYCDIMSWSRRGYPVVSRIESMVVHFYTCCIQVKNFMLWWWSVLLEITLSNITSFRFQAEQRFVLDRCNRTCNITMRTQIVKYTSERFCCVYGRSHFSPHIIVRGNLFSYLWHRIPRTKISDLSQSSVDSDQIIILGHHFNSTPATQDESDKSSCFWWQLSFDALIVCCKLLWSQWIAMVWMISERGSRHIQNNGVLIP